MFGRLAEAVHAVGSGARRSVTRAKLEAEQRTLERRHAEALRALGARVQELVGAGTLADDAIQTELAEVRAQEMLIAAKEAEVEDVTARG